MPIIYICDVCVRKIGNHRLDRPILMPKPKIADGYHVLVLGTRYRVLCIQCATPEELGDKIDLPFSTQWPDGKSK